MREESNRDKEKKREVTQALESDTGFSERERGILFRLLFSIGNKFKPIDVPIIVLRSSRHNADGLLASRQCDGRSNGLPGLDRNWHPNPRKGGA